MYTKKNETSIRRSSIGRDSRHEMGKKMGLTCEGAMTSVGQLDMGLKENRTSL